MSACGRVGPCPRCRSDAGRGAVDPGNWAALRDVDQRMAAIRYRLATGNAALCRELQPAPGLQLHAIRFWREEGGMVDGGPFRSPMHPSAKARADALTAEFATLPPAGTPDTAPAVLATRDSPL